ncbi:Polyketide synthase [Frankia sp. Hr75.2]|nr:Polyketide synthase [Frankia sp. Hr75.2]
MPPTPQGSDGLARMIAGLSAEKRAVLASLVRADREPVAILGLSCRFPGAADPEAFWRLLVDGRDAVREVPRDRWDVDAFYDPDPQAPGGMVTRSAGLLDDVDTFDSGFFGISRREAVRMDPQQRLFLEVAWEALEDAGQAAGALAGTATGVFAGVCANDYGTLQFGDIADVDAYVATGNAHSIVANRLSYFLDLVGPSVAVDTACSSSLVAVHLACQSLQTGESSMAVVGGVHLILSPLAHILFSRAQMLAPDGRCKTFDARADGFARGEGCGVVVLKRLSDALAAGDPIRAVIQGSAVNQDGRSNGLTAPSGLSQQAVVRRAHDSAGITPGQVGYVEAHGTGTALGDPIEVEALAEVFGPPAAPGAVCALGSVKTNIGHLEGAAGIAGLIKAVLALEHRVIPPTLHFGTLNPNITLAGTPFVIPTAPLPWPATGGRRYAGVSAFGFGGTNAHAVLAEAPPTRAGGPVDPGTDAGTDAEPGTGADTSGGGYLLTLSARSAESLRALAGRYRDVLTADAAPPVRDVCHTAGTRRSHLDHRLAVAGRGGNLADRLGDFLEARPHPDVAAGIRPVGRRGLVLVFSGQGGQWAGMGHQLAAREPVFRQALHDCAVALAPFTGWSVLDELTADGAGARLDRTEIGQPAVFAVQVALARLWRSWGITPDAVVGHSMGEVAAAHVAGALSLADAARVIAHRGALMAGAGGGRMVAVDLPPAAVARVVAPVADRVCVAAVNGPRSVVLAGDGDALDEVVAALRGDGVRCRALPVGYAFHSHHMRPLRARLVDALAGLRPVPPVVPVYSTVDGPRLDGRSHDAAYWAANMCEPVRFAAAVDALLADGHRAFLEVGPHPELALAIDAAAADSGQPVLVAGSLRRGQPERATLLRSLAALYAAGWDAELAAVNPLGAHVRLPHYPWKRERHWHQPAAGGPGLVPAPRGPGEIGATGPDGLASSDGLASPDGGTHPLLGRRIAAAVAEVIHEVRLTAATPPFLTEHRLHGQVIVPAVAYLEMVLAATDRVLGPGPCVVSDVLLTEPLILPESAGRVVQVTLLPQEGGTAATFRVASRADGGPSTAGPWRLHVNGRVRLGDGEAPTRAEAPTAVRPRLTREVSVEMFYDELTARGFDYGPGFRGVAELWGGDGEALGRVDLEAVLAGDPPVGATGAGNSVAGPWRLHPCVLEACLQVAGGLADDIRAGGDDAYIPIGLDRLVFRPGVGTRLWSHARLRSGGRFTGQTVVCDVTLLDEDGAVRGAIDGLLLKRVPRATVERSWSAGTDEWLYDVRWRPLPLPPAADRPRAGTAGEAGSAGSPAWLLLADDGGVGDGVAGALAAAGLRTVVAVRGHGFAAAGPDRYEVDPTDPAALARLVTVVAAEVPLLAGVMHLWSLDTRLGSDAGADALMAAQDRGCRSTLHLIQALAAAPWGSQPPRLWLATRGAVPAAGRVDAAGAAQAPLWGLGAVIAQEHPELWGGLVDLDPRGTGPSATGGPTSGPPADPVVEPLIAVLTAADGEDRVALRDGVRWGMRLAPSLLRGRTALPLVVRPDASYLITGGLGGIGLEVARGLAERGARHLVLMGRSEPSAAADAVIDEIRRVGVQVLVARGDVARAEDVARALTAIDGTGRPLAGVMHAAGVLDDGVLVRQDWASFARVLAPKLAGAWELHRQTLGHPLEFFALFSSAAAPLGSPGQGGYAAANAFLGALAHTRHADDLCATAIYWGPWAQVGMAAATAAGATRPVWADLGQIHPEKGVGLLARIIAAGSTEVAVLPVDAELLGAVWPAGRRPALLDDVLPLPSASATLQRSGIQGADELLARLRTVRPADRAELVADFLRTQIHAVLGADPADPPDLSRGFFDIGMDSLMALELKNRLQVVLGRPIPATLVFEYPTVDELSAILAAEMLPADVEAAEGIGTIDPTVLAEIDRLSDQEVDTALTRLLEADGGTA